MRQVALSPGAKGGNHAACGVGRTELYGTGPDSMIRCTCHNSDFGRNSHMNSYLGSLLLVPYNFAPQGWAFCQGQLLPISQNTALFSLIGTTFGGDGVTNFKLPNLTEHKDASGAALKWIIALVGVYPSRD